MIEILAPAGSFDSARAAVNAGADAVYMGGSRFGARAYAQSVEEDRGLETLDYVHFYGKKLYLTVNTLVKERELDSLPAFLKPYWEHGLDAVIVQDLGVWQRIREEFPGLPVHVSTQMTLTGPWGARWMEREGASRIVTARELSLKELEQIRRAVSIEIEAFVHGAICYCYSGQCLMSSLIGGRSGNRGRCAQPCRLPYSLGEKKGYLMNIKDMCTLEAFPRIIEAGVNSLKIEGRMKSPVYTAGVASIYRKYVDQYLERGPERWRPEAEDLRILSELYDRGGTTSDYLWKHNGKDMIALAGRPSFRAVDETVVREIESQYLHKDLQLKIYGIVTLQTGKPAKISMEYQGVSCEWEGAEVQQAQKRPLDEETVRRQMMKTGNTGFTFRYLEIRMEGECFLNMQALNELRRKGLETLRKAMVSRHFRLGACPARNQGAASGRERTERTDREQAEIEETGPEPAEGAGSRKLPEVTLLLPGFAGTAWACEIRGVSHIIVDEEQGDRLEDLRNWAELAHSRGKHLYYRMPAVLREQDAGRLWNSRELLEDSGIDGLVLKNADEAGMVCEGHMEMPVILDHSLYTWNRQALAFLRNALGSRLLRETLPLELNAGELRDRGCRGAELVGYGYIPLMVTAGCVAKTAGSCRRSESLLYLTDRKNVRFPVKTRCKSCYNIIYNTAPLYLLDQMEELRRLNPGSIRLEFSVEPAEHQRELARQFTTQILGGTGSPPEMAYTRGHFRRGVD